MLLVNNFVSFSTFLLYILFKILQHKACKGRKTRTNGNEKEGAGDILQTQKTKGHAGNKHQEPQQTNTKQKQQYINTYSYNLLDSIPIHKEDKDF
jgi:hypothetical protein